MKLMAAFIGFVGIISLVANTVDIPQPQFLFSQEETGTSSRLLESLTPQNYIVLQVNTLTSKSFNIMGLRDETIFDIKNRI